MDEDEVLGKITRLLERGCTMLATHHDCGAPLFRCEGNIVCPVCSFDEGPLAEQSSPSDQGREKEDERSAQDRAHLPQKGDLRSSANYHAERQDRSAQADGDLISAKENLCNALVTRMRELTASLQAEQDLYKLKKQMDCLEGLLRLLKSLRE